MGHFNRALLDNFSEAAKNMELDWPETTTVPNDPKHRRTLDTNLHFTLTIQAEWSRYAQTRCRHI